MGHFNAKFCSDECRKEHQLQLKKNKVGVCIECGATFIGRPYAKYCEACGCKKQREHMLGDNNPARKYPRPRTEEEKEALRERNKGNNYSKDTVGVNNGIINKRVHKSILDEFLKDNPEFTIGWKPGTIKNKPPNPNIMSKKAKIIYEKILESSIHEIETEVTFDDCYFKGKLAFDFKCVSAYGNTFLIEYDGEQHEYPINWYPSIEKNYSNFISLQCKDWIKDKYCIDNNIPLIRIKASKQTTFEEIYKNNYLVGKAQGSDNVMHCLGVIDCDCINNKDITYTILSGYKCTFKCNKEANDTVCHNASLSNNEPIIIEIDKLINRYINQDIAHCITFQGLEPLDSLKELLWFIYKFRKVSDDKIFIWTGYTKKECKDLIALIKMMNWGNIVFKFGRYIPGHKPHYDEVLGVNLASDNQWGEEIELI